MIAAGAAFPVEDATEVSAARRAAQRLAEHAGFSEARAGTVALVASELATNLAKHAHGGRMVFRATEHPAVVEILALDRGPGIPDLAQSQRDGYSTAGTRGVGLGAVARQADDYQVYSTPSGTAILARVAREPGEPAARTSRLEVGGIRVNAPGEAVCGDDWSVHVREGRIAVMVADGLGHGLAAHDAARAAHAAFAHVHERTPAEAIEDIHRALHGTRGAAVAILAIDIERGHARYCGLGNISGAIFPRDGLRHSLVSQNGTAGVSRPRITEFQYPFPPGAMVVMHSDGVGTHWELATYAGLRVKHPTLIAGVLFRDHRRERDDASVVVVKDRPAMAPA
jgi:anti-sigma regulatory factor (Ser/Thr protein kinase)